MSTEDQKPSPSRDAGDSDTNPLDDASFDSDERRKIRAACGAFLYVAFADANFDPSEEARMLAVLVNREPFSGYDAKILEAEYNALVAVLHSDYAAAAKRIIDDIEWSKADPETAQAVIAAARSAIVADARLEAQEEAALARIANALDLAPGDI
ncbi:MAG: tellurite resistance TerB family protein [Pseudomonadota bacterium]